MSEIDGVVRQLCGLRVSELAESSLLLGAKCAVAPRPGADAKARAVRGVVLVEFGRSEIAL